MNGAETVTVLLTAVASTEVIVGATSAIATANESLSLPPSWSSTETLTVLEASPSAKEQSKLPAPVAVFWLSFDLLPLAPQSVEIRNAPESGSTVL